MEFFAKNAKRKEDFDRGLNTSLLLLLESLEVIYKNLLHSIVLLLEFFENLVLFI